MTETTDQTTDTVAPAEPTAEPLARYLSRPEVAARIGVKPDTLNRYRLPPHDAEIGRLKGWSPGTVDEWNAQRPGHGGRRPAPAPIEPPEPAEDLIGDLIGDPATVEDGEG